LPGRSSDRPWWRAGDATPEALAELVAHVDEIAEIPNSIRRGTVVRRRTG
jgi:hypothetical protein